MIHCILWTQQSTRVKKYAINVEQTTLSEHECSHLHIPILIHNLPISRCSSQSLQFFDPELGFHPWIYSFDCAVWPFFTVYSNVLSYLTAWDVHLPASFTIPVSLSIKARMYCVHYMCECGCSWHISSITFLRVIYGLTMALLPLFILLCMYQRLLCIPASSLTDEINHVSGKFCFYYKLYCCKCVKVTANS